MTIIRKLALSFQGFKDDIDDDHESYKMAIYFILTGFSFFFILMSVFVFFSWYYQRTKILLDFSILAFTIFLLFIDYKVIRKAIKGDREAEDGNTE